ncbi:MAG: hypothetical protein OWQ51_00295 [Pyrobaculum arsenaticum]|uniref:Uncharacterized protein n=4 Tax=Pyrobaculum TaxID=2276 RepID=A4WLU2_PYRAR|nr:hypothetical protein [Pyrobaculum arsenaticum]ABP51359.1 conserved hypothetical protein [Pyrobaculum arsenaticum DSM 13514]MCY0889412.1 hypothetical protein [Pyrobaculum arsenaticum]NYR16271.1 hypothetical protein [Pyrobaculum arsenaticum]
MDVKAHVEVYIVFNKEPPEEWMRLPGVRAIKAEELVSIDKKIVLVVGDRELAKQLGVGYLDEEEASELLQYLKRLLGGR